MRHAFLRVFFGTFAILLSACYRFLTMEYTKLDGIWTLQLLQAQPHANLQATRL